MGLFNELGRIGSKDIMNAIHAGIASTVNTIHMPSKCEKKTTNTMNKQKNKRHMVSYMSSVET